MPKILVASVALALVAGAALADDFVHVADPALNRLATERFVRELEGTSWLGPYLVRKDRKKVPDTVGIIQVVADPREPGKRTCAYAEMKVADLASPDVVAKFSKKSCKDLGKRLARAQYPAIDGFVDATPEGMAALRALAGRDYAAGATHGLRWADGRARELRWQATAGFTFATDETGEWLKLLNGIFYTTVGGIGSSGGSSQFRVGKVYEGRNEEGLRVLRVWPDQNQEGGGYLNLSVLDPAIFAAASIDDLVRTSSPGTCERECQEKVTLAPMGFAGRYVDVVLEADGGVRLVAHAMKAPVASFPDQGGAPLPLRVETRLRPVSR